VTVERADLAGHGPAGNAHGRDAAGNGRAGHGPDGAPLDSAG